MPRLADETGEQVTVHLDADAVNLEELATRARALIASPGRVILGVTGEPGAGKSTFVEALMQELRKAPPPGLGPDWVAHLPMDGFHLADVQLRRLGNLARKGAPDTFDSAGYVATLERVAGGGADTVYAPGFERTLEQPLAAAVAILPEARLVVTEGNYLLLPDGHWPRARALMAEVWYLDLPQDTRRERLIARHTAFGKEPADAAAWVDGPDEHNARLVREHRCAADLFVGPDAGRVIASAPHA